MSSPTPKLVFESLYQEGQPKLDGGLIPVGSFFKIGCFLRFVADPPKFYELPLEKRRKLVETRADSIFPTNLDDELANGMAENCIGSFSIPVGVLPSILIDGVEYQVPMAVEESSVIAAASHGAKLALPYGFTTKCDEPILTGQIEIRELEDQVAARNKFNSSKVKWLAAVNLAEESMVKRGGGALALELREIGPGHAVIHLHMDCRDAMGANVMNRVLERHGAEWAAALGGEVGLRILTNLSTKRLARAFARIPVANLAGLAEAMVAAQHFAEVDPYRASTHNKGIMNGIDPVVIATGNDWRAVEAGAHAFAVKTGRYGPLTRYSIRDGHLECSIELPLAVGTVGGVTKIHPQAQFFLKLLGNPSSKQLAGIIASVGLAQNISALKALAGEGIQRGHMELHAANIVRQAGINTNIAEIVAKLIASGEITESNARKLAAQR